MSLKVVLFDLDGTLLPMDQDIFVKYYFGMLANRLAPLGYEKESLMVGNDVDEDMIAKELGMEVFLIPKCLINKENKDISVYPQGGFADLVKFIKEKI